MSQATISPSIAVYQGRAGGWPGYPTFTDPTLFYIASPLTVNWASGPLTYTFSGGIGIPQQAQIPQTFFITLADALRSGTATIFIDTDSGRWSQASLAAQPFAALGIIQSYVNPAGAATPAATPTFAGVNKQTGNYTVQASDLGKLIVVTGDPSADVIITFPAAGSAGFGNNFFVDIQNDMSTHTGVVTNRVLISSPAGTGIPILVPQQGCRIFSDGSQYWSQNGTVQLFGITGIQFQVVSQINTQGTIFTASAPTLNGSTFLSPGLTGNLAATPIYTTAAPGNNGASGYYLIPFTAWTTTAGSAGTVTVTITWTDENSLAKSFTSASFSLTATDITGQVNGMLAISVKASQAINISTTVTGATGNPVYSVRARAIMVST